MATSPGARDLATNINSAQFNFAQSELDFIARNYIYVDHDQSWTVSAGAAYTFNQGSDYATRVGADFLFQNGLRKTIYTPNDFAVPPYGVFNLSATQNIPIKARAAPSFASTR
jgi:hypothetical protein